MKPRAKNTQSIDSKVFARIYGHGRGYVFTPTDFLDLGSRSAVDTALTRGVRSGEIRKLARGLYDFPKKDPQLGDLMPPTEAVVRAPVGRDEVKPQPSGAHAANVLGL